MARDIDLLAIGELNPDLVLTGLHSMPVPGREILSKNYKLTLGSSTAICAAAAASLGLNTWLMSKVGCDVFGNACLEFLENTGIHADYVRTDPNVQTGITISLSDQNDRALVTSLCAIEQMGAEELDISVFRRAKHIHVGSFFLQTNLRKGLADLFRKAKQAGATTSLDAGWDDTGCWDYGLKDVLQYTDVFFPNESEATAITGEKRPDDAARKLAGYCGCAVVKCGSDGALACHGGSLLRQSAVSGVSIVDTTGAGDSFNAGFLYAYIHEKTFSECLRYGTACAAISITRLGGASACATLAEVEQVIRTHLLSDGSRTQEQKNVLD